MKRIPVYRLIPRHFDMVRFCYWLTVITMGLLFGLLGLYCLIKG